VPPVRATRLAPEKLNVVKVNVVVKVEMSRASEVAKTAPVGLLEVPKVPV
jgi:hypothetical protein